MIICLGFVSLLLWAIPATALGVTVTADNGFVEGGFRLRGSHGFSISAFAFGESSKPRATIFFMVHRHGESATYRAPAIVTQTEIRANLGDLGKVEVVRVPSGRERKVHPKCPGRPLTYEPATYEGVIEFNGEGGYTRARESRVAQVPAFLLLLGALSCGGQGSGEGTGSSEPGARLRGLSFAHGRTLSFQINKNRQKGPTVFTASLKEHHGAIWINREVSGEAPPSAFRYDQHLRSATLSPPSPFSGSATASRSRNSVSRILTGDLKLNFPGRSVPLTGPAVHVTLVHARFTRSNGPHAEISTGHMHDDPRLEIAMVDQGESLSAMTLPVSLLGSPVDP